MSLLFTAAILALFAVISSSTTAGYESKYDNIDLDEVLTNERLLKNYVNCLMSEGPCSPDGQELKSINLHQIIYKINLIISIPDTLPDAIQTECSMCSEKQKQGADKVTHFLIDNKPDEWERLAKVYDQNGEYKMKYLAAKETEDNLE